MLVPIPLLLSSAYNNINIIITTDNQKVALWYQDLNMEYR
jgi:hypothetical protein